MAFTFKQLFFLELGDMYNSEQQIINELPNVIKAVENDDLKNALQEHLDQTRQQLKRLKKIFSILNENPHNEECLAMKGILQEGREFVERLPKSALRDAALIGACQKVEHYEIGSYGTIYSHAKILDYPKEVLNLLNETLDEEASADKKLTDLAEGGFFTDGINAEALEPATAGTDWRKPKEK